MGLTLAQIETFYEEGYLLLENVFQLEEIQKIKDCFDYIQGLAAQFNHTVEFGGSQFVVEGPRIHRVVWAAGVAPFLGKVGADPRITVPVAQLLGSDVLTQLICQTHFKLPGDEVEFPWHQDSLHRRFGTREWRDINGRGSYVQTILAVDHVHAGNGPVGLIPRTPKLGHIMHDGLVPPHYLNAADIIRPEMQPGSLLLFGPYLIHGSEPNRSNESRRILINGFCYPGANRKLYPGCGRGHTVEVPHLRETALPDVHVWAGTKPSSQA